MKTRAEIQTRLNQYLSNELGKVLEAPLIDKIKIYSKQIDTRLELRTAPDEKTLNSWYSQPIYLLATPEDGNTLFQIEVQPQRWPKNLKSFVESSQIYTDEVVARVNTLSKEFLFKVKSEAVSKLKGNDKFMQSVKIILSFEDDITELNNLKKIRDFIAEIAIIGNEYSDNLNRLLDENSLEYNTNNNLPDNEKIKNVDLFPSSIPLQVLEQIYSYYSTDQNKLVEYLYEINETYSFDYGGWIYTESYEDLLDEIEKLSSNFTDLFSKIEFSIENIKEESLSENEKWYKLLTLISNEVSNTGGKLLKMLTPDGGYDYSFLLLSNEKHIIPMTLLYHFSDAINNASGWFDEYVEDFNIDYVTFLEKHGFNLHSETKVLNYEIQQSVFGTEVNSNIKILNISEEVHNAALIGMMAAKNYC
jgi:hypothetical protein